MRSIRPRSIAIAAVLVALVSLPLWLGNSYYINIASQILLWAVLALARTAAGSSVAAAG